MNRKMSFKKKIISVSLVMALLVPLALPLSIQAGAITPASDTMSRLKISTASNHTIVFTTPAGVAAGETMTFTFPAGFTIGSVDFTDIDVADDGADLTLAASASGATWGAVFSGQVLTITSGTGTIAGASVVTVEIGTNATFGTTGDQQITNPGSAGSNKIDVAGTFADSGSMAVGITADDQVGVSASVGESLTFTINDTVVDLGALDTASVSTDTTNFDVTTNASSGYTVTITEDGNLRDGGNDVDDVSDGTVTAGSEEYGVSTDETDSVDIALTSGNNATGIDGTNKSAATQSGPISSDNTVLTFHASIALTTNPGNYAHTTTMIATGNF